MSTRDIGLTLSPHTATGFLWPDNSVAHTATTTTGRLSWPVDEAITGGTRWRVESPGYQPAEGRGILPLGSNELEREVSPGVFTTEPLALEPLNMPLEIRGDQFVRNGTRWLVKGSTELQLAARIARGEDVRPVLHQRKDAGANLVRVLGMHEGAGFLPSMTEAYASVVRQTIETAASFDLVTLWCVFTGAKQMMPSQSQQLEFWQYAQDLVRPYADHLLIDLGNEMNHSEWGGVDPSAFPKPQGLLSSRGSFLTDEQPPAPWWDFVVYHARRDFPSPKGATNYSPYVYYDIGEWPYVPMFAEEGIKPHNYGFDHNWVRLMAQYAKAGCGALFHTEHGVYSQSWPPEVEACARVFYGELS